MSVTTNKAKIKDTLRVLHEQWASLRHGWKDSAATSIESDAVAPADDAVRIAILAIDQLSESIERARRDCDAG